MKHTYRDIRHRHKRSGVFDESAYTQNSELQRTWDTFDTNSIKLGAGYALYRDINTFLIKNGIVARDARFSHKLAAFLSKPEASLHHLPRLSYGDVVSLFTQYTNTGSAVETAAKFYESLGLIPPITPEQHHALIEAQKISLGTVALTGKNAVTEAIKSHILRPILTSSRVVEARLAQEEVYRQQNFLPDGRPAGIQHVLAEQAAKGKGGGTMGTMTHGETPAGTSGEGGDGALEQKRLDFITAVRALIGKLGTPTTLTDQDISALELIATKKLTTFSDVPVTAVDVPDGGIHFTFNGSAVDELKVTKVEKDAIDKILSEQNVSESAKAARAEFESLISWANNAAEIGRIQFKHLQQLVRLCESAPTMQFSYLDDEHPYLLTSKETVTRGREFSLDGAVVGAITSADIARFNDVVGSELARRVEAEARKISGNKQEEVDAISQILQNAEWSQYVIQARQGSSVEAPLQAALQSMKTTNSTDAHNMQLHRALTALAAGLGYNHLAEFFAPVLGENTEAHAHRPRVLNRILVEGKKYKDAAEQQFVASLLALTDGVDKAWGTYSLQIATDATTGTKTYTYTGRDSAKRTFTLTSEEQAKLANTGPETGSEKEVEGMKLAIGEIQTRLSKIERDSTNDGLDADKKAKNIQYIDLLLKDELAFPGVYYVRDTKKPKDGERSKDKRIKVSLLKNVSADAVTISGNPIPGYSGPIPNVIIEKAKLIALKAKFEQKKTEDPKIPEDFKAALGVLPTWDKTKFFDNDARAVLDKYLKPLFDSAHRPAKIGDFDVADDAHSFKFSKDGKHAFTITASQVALWKEISAIPKPTEPPTLAPSDALPPGTLEKSIVGEAGWEDELGRRIGTKLLMDKLDMKQGEISKEKALGYVKGLSFWKRMGLYTALALTTTAAAVGTAIVFSSCIVPLLGGWGATLGLKWAGLVGTKMFLAAGAGLGTNWAVRKHFLDRYWGIAGEGEKQISFFERSKDAARYYRILKEFKREKKVFDTKEGKLARARNHMRAAGTPEFIAAKYQMSMDAAMAHGEKGAQNERRRQFLIPIAIGGGIAGATAYYHWDIIKSLMPGSRPPSGAVPPTVGRGGPPPLTRGGQPPIQPQGPRFVQDRFGRWILPNSGQVIEVYCGAPRATCVPCDFTINGTRAHWYINSFADSMRVSSPKGGMSYLLGNMNAIPGGRATQEQVWALFERTLCADRDLYRTFNNVGNSSRGKWIDFAVLKETTWIGGRKQTMIDVMIDRAQNENVRSTLRAMRESIIQNNPRLSVRLAR